MLNHQGTKGTKNGFFVRNKMIHLASWRLGGEKFGFFWVLCFGAVFFFPPCRVQGETFFLDLSRAANRGLTETFDPSAGAEDAQEKSGFSRLPLGAGKFRGIPFHILDPSHNQGRALVALKGSRQPGYPE